MTPIFVWAVVTDPRGVLLIPARAADGWLLPGGPLRDDDDSVEAAIAREVEQRLGVRLTDEPDFLDTCYERRADGTTIVHNLFHIPTATLPGGLTIDDHASRWVDLTALDDAGLPDWLRNGLAALTGEESPDLPFDFGEIQAALTSRQDTAPVFIITGPAAAGKSTVARELCKRFPLAAHISVDAVRDMVVSGYAPPVPGRSDPDEAAVQSRLATWNAAACARNFAAEGIVAVIDEVLETPAGLDDYLAALGPIADLRVVTLLPDAATLAARDADRAPGDRMGARSAELHRIIAANGERRGLRLDTSTLSVEETVDTILERTDEAQLTPAEAWA